MYSLLTDDKNDLYMSAVGTDGGAIYGAELAHANESEALRQVIVNRIRLQRGEYKYNLSRGVDYMGLLLTDTPLVRLWEKEVFDIINEIPEIRGIKYWNYGLDDNNFEFQLTVDSDYGIIEIKG